MIAQVRLQLDRPSQPVWLTLKTQHHYLAPPNHRWVLLSRYPTCPLIHDRILKGIGSCDPLPNRCDHINHANSGEIRIQPFLGSTHKPTTRWIKLDVIQMLTKTRSSRILCSHNRRCHTACSSLLNRVAPRCRLYRSPKTRLNSLLINPMVSRIRIIIWQCPRQWKCSRSPAIALIT